MNQTGIMDAPFLFLPLKGLGQILAWQMRFLNYTVQTLRAQRFEFHSLVHRQRGSDLFKSMAKTDLKFIFPDHQLKVSPFKINASPFGDGGLHF